jgi:hypothetical protein
MSLRVPELRHTILSGPNGASTDRLPKSVTVTSFLSAQTLVQFEKMVTIANSMVKMELEITFIPKIPLNQQSADNFNLWV